MEEGRVWATGLIRVCVLGMLFVWRVTASQRVEPHDRTDTMGAYRLANSEQCRRLCWYRQLCTSFSFTFGADTRLEGNNCVLHSSHVEDASSQQGEASSGWTETIVQQPVAAFSSSSTTSTSTTSTSASSTSCTSSRPCGPAEVCVPQFPGSFRCLPLPAQCGGGEAPGNHAVEMTGLWQQGDAATVQCLPDFVEVPRHVEITCQVTSRWTRWTGECVRGVYRDVKKTPFPWSRLPWAAADGELRVCFTGLFNTSERAKVVVWGGDNSGDVILRVDFRRRFEGEKYIKVDSEINGQTGAGVNITSPQMSLEAGDRFSVSLHVTTDLFLLNLTRNDDPRNDVTFRASTPPGIQLQRAHYFQQRGEGFLLDNVNLVSTCA